MVTATKSKPNLLAVIGYSVWFFALVRLLYMATNDQSSSNAESFGVHLGIGIALLALLGIPYFILRIRSKRRDAPIPWFLVMMWTTIIALLLAVGGFYGRLHSKGFAGSPLGESQENPPTPASAPADDNWMYSNSPLAEPTAGSVAQALAGEWRCTRGSSTAPTRLLLAPDGSTSGTTEGSTTLIQDPWLRWYVPNRRTGEQMYFLRIMIRSTNNIAVKYPNEKVDDCLR